ncbi:MAG: anaerobic sulfatase maturase [Eubacterium sp.]|nr:anaerobic sulfatase maturase [Eubacterium sp.]
MMQFLNTLIKPVSGACNLDCSYCFYKELVEQLPQHMCMSDETMRALIDRALSSGAREILFAFQGGEPMLAGEEYYERFIAYVNQKKTNQKVTYSIQTNGTILSDAYIALFLEHDFLVGISLDGPAYVQNHHRVTVGGKETFADVFANVKRLMAAGVKVNVLSVITKYSSSRAEKLYKFYKKTGFEFIQFLPCMDPVLCVQGAQEDSLGTDDYERFLCDFFDCWYRDFMAGEYISVRHFDNWIRMMCGQQAESCALSGVCSSYFVIESNGDVYPCDFYVMEEKKLGNVMEHDFNELQMRASESGFLTEPIQQRSEDCAVCPYRIMCNGGCKRDRIYEGDKGKTRYCEALKRFFAKNVSKMQEVVRMLQ